MLISCSTITNDTASAMSARLDSSAAFRPAGPADATQQSTMPTTCSLVRGNKVAIPHPTAGTRSTLIAIASTNTHTRRSGARTWATVNPMPRLITKVVIITNSPGVEQGVEQGFSGHR